jgi:hypothetical protein
MAIITSVDTHGATITKLPEPLGADNWMSWKTRILSALQTCRVLGYVQGTVPAPSPGAEGFAESSATWELNDSFARTTLLNNISNEQLIHAQNAKTAKEMWDNLAAVHEDRGHLTAVALQRNLWLTIAKDGDDIPEHLSKLKKLWERINNIDDDDYRITDSRFKTMIASSLPPSWDTFTDPYISKRSDPEENLSKRRIRSQDFIGVLIEEYRRRQERSQQEQANQAVSTGKNRKLANRIGGVAALSVNILHEISVVRQERSCIQPGNSARTATPPSWD